MRQACLKKILDLAKIDNKILFIGSDLGPGVMNEFKKKFPKRFFMEGVSEQSIIGLSAGLAMEGFKPYVNTIATFLTRRCFDQIVIDLCLHNLPVRLIGNGGGLVYAPLGPTHQAIEDISILRPIPNISIIAPCDAVETEKLLSQTKNLKKPIYFRIAKGGDRIITKKKEKIKYGKSSLKIVPKDYLLVSTGVMTQIAMNAAKKINILKKKKVCGVLHFGTIKPLDTYHIKKYFPKVKKIVTIEENVLSGGFGSSILETTSEISKNNTQKISRIGLADQFVQFYGTQEDLFKKNNLTTNAIIKKILN